MALPQGQADYFRQQLVQLSERVAELIALVDTLDRPDPPPPPAPVRPLEGLKLAVVGPSFREQHYREVLEPLGAVLLFAASEEKLGRVYRVCSKAHGIIYVTTFCSHAVEAQIGGLADRRGLPVVRLPFKGLDRLRDTALELAPDMQAYKELIGEAK